MDILTEMRTLIGDAALAADAEERVTLEGLLELFDQPLRIAIAGMVKAGKSTLMNSLVAQRIAATDAGECTRIVTYYQRGPRYRVVAVDADGSESDLRFDRGETLEIHLDGRDEAEIDHLRVDWPSDRLSGRQLIDTPGLGSVSADVSQRSVAFLAAESDTPVDAVIYLMRHRHPANVDFLEAFHGGFSSTGGMSAIGVLSRADELAGGRVGALDVAGRVAETMSSDQRLRSLCQAVFPVAGLLAETATTLRHEEYVWLAALAELPLSERQSILLSVDRFRSAPLTSPDTSARERLLTRFGLFGLRLAADLITSDRCRSSDQLADHLSSLSGVGRVQREILMRFDARRAALRARTAMSVLAGLKVVDDPAVSAGFERLAANAHEVYELNLLDRLRGREVKGLDVESKEGLERVLGSQGPAPERRLGIAEASAHDVIGEQAGEQMDIWRRLSEHPLSTPEVQHLSRMATRSLESLVLTGTSGQSNS